MLRNTSLNKKINQKLNKKAELTFTQIIIAVISIIVLIIIIMVFTGQIGGSSEKLSSCAINKGECISEDKTCDGIVLPGLFTECNEDKPRCCVSYMSSSSDNSE